MVAARRNAEGIDRVLDGFREEARRQGYRDPEAIDALAQKQLSEMDDPPRRWRTQDILTEQTIAENRRKALAGETMRCTVCGNTAPARDGVILAHSQPSTASDGYADTCKGGYGTLGEPITYDD